MRRVLSRRVLGEQSAEATAALPDVGFLAGHIGVEVLPYPGEFASVIVGESVAHFIEAEAEFGEPAHPGGQDGAADAVGR